MRDRRTGLLLGGVCALVLLMACELNLPAPPGGADESIVLAPPGGVETPDEAQTAGGTEPEPPQGARGLVRFVLDQRLFVLLAILGLALCVVTGFGVFALIRRRPRRAKRQGRRGDKSSSLVEKTDQMPEGVVLGEGQYLVVRRLPVSAGASVYEVKATSPTPLCPRCWAPADDAAVQNACHRCGAPLGEALSAAPRLIAREALEPQTYAVSAELLTDQLAHPSVVTPIAVFADASFGELRYYQVEPLVEERLATTLDRPQSLDNVLDWGADLARGLAYLHDHGVVLDRVTLEQRVEEHQPRQVNHAVAFHALKDQLLELLYSEVPIETVVKKLQIMFLGAPVSVRPGRNPPRRKPSMFRSYHFQRRVRKTVL